MYVQVNVTLKVEYDVDILVCSIVAVVQTRVSSDVLYIQTTTSPAGAPTLPKLISTIGLVKADNNVNVCL